MADTSFEAHYKQKIETLTKYMRRYLANTGYEPAFFTQEGLNLTPLPMNPDSSHVPNIIQKGINPEDWPESSTLFVALTRQGTLASGENAHQYLAGMAVEAHSIKPWLSRGDAEYPMLALNLEHPSLSLTLNPLLHRHPAVAPPSNPQARRRSDPPQNGISKAKWEETVEPEPELDIVPAK